MRDLSLWHMHSLVVVDGLSCPTQHVGSSFPHQESNPRPLHCKVDPYPLDLQGSPSLPLEGDISRVGLALPDVPWSLRIWARRCGPVFIGWLPSPPSFSFLIWFLWRQGSLSNSSARAALVPSSRSAFAILTGCCGDAVTRLGTGAPGLSWCGCYGDGTSLERREGGLPQPCSAVALLPAGLQLKNRNSSPPTPMQYHSPFLYFRQKASINVDGIYYNIAAVSEHFLYTRHCTKHFMCVFTLCSQQPPRVHSDFCPHFILFYF